MERHEILAMMVELKLLGMRLAFDEVLANGVKRQHAAQQIVGDLLASEIAEKQARSIRYQVNSAKLPLAKELSDGVVQNPAFLGYIRRAETAGL